MLSLTPFILASVFTVVSQWIDFGVIAGHHKVVAGVSGMMYLHSPFTGPFTIIAERVPLFIRRKKGRTSDGREAAPWRGGQVEAGL
jgi:hypothetical protein